MIVNAKGADMKKAVFIDTNVFLMLYDFSKDDLGKLERLSDFLSKNSIKLYLTNQVKDEFFRNRENIIKRALDTLENLKFNLKLPTLANNFEEDCRALNESKKSYEQIHATLCKRIKKAALESSLKADNIMNSIFTSKSVRFLEHNHVIYCRSMSRIKLGNPPGKRNDIGDAINWELLLENLERNVGLIIISADNDYSSQLDDRLIHPFLSKEWRSKKSSDVELFKNLSTFFEKYIPDLQLNDEGHSVIDGLIMSLEFSSDFKSTHNIVYELSKHQDDLNPQQVDRIVDAYLNNSQVNWIMTDGDIKSFICYLIDKYESGIESDKRAAIKQGLEGDF